VQEIINSHTALPYCFIHFSFSLSLFYVLLVSVGQKNLLSEFYDLETDRFTKLSLNSSENVSNDLKWPTDHDGH